MPTADLLEVEKKFRDLRERYITRSLSRERFQEEALKLRLQDDAGTWWQVLPSDGSWVRWDGARWIPGDPFTDGKWVRPAVAPGSKVPAGEESESTTTAHANDVSSGGFWNFMRVILKGIATGFVKNLPWILLVSIIIWVLHILLAQVAMHSAGQAFASVLSSILVRPGNELVGAVFWLLVGWLVSKSIFLVRYRNFGKSVQNIRRVPGWVQESFRISGAKSCLLLLFGGTCALAIAALIQNVLVSIQLVLVSLGWLAANKEGMIVALGGVVWGSVNAIFHRGSISPDYPSLAGPAVLGSVGGFLLSIFVPLMGLAGVLVLFAIIIAVLGSAVSRRGTP